MKLGKLDSIYHYVRNKTRFSTYFMYVKTKEQELLGVYMDGRIDNELKILIKSMFDNIDIFKIEMGYEETCNKSYMLLKEKVENDFFGIIIFEKDELIQDRLGTEVIEYDYLYGDTMLEKWAEMYMSDNYI